MELLSIKWLWMYAGAVLMLLEIMAPGFVVFFFGLAAATVGLILFGVDLSGTLQVALFSALSVLYLLTLRRFLKSIFVGDTTKSQKVDGEYVGRVGRVVEAIRPEVPGRILLGDAEWTASATEWLAPGTEVRVVAQRNLTMSVEKLES